MQRNVPARWADALDAWRPPADWIRVRTVDLHTAGEPLRVIVSGWPVPEGGTILQRRKWAREHQDDLRRGLMWEPRGHADMYGCLVVPPERRDSDFGVLFLHNEGFSTMCGHGIIGVATAAVELGLAAPSPGPAHLRIDTPAGLVTAEVEVAGGRPGPVRFRNVPSFVQALDRVVEVGGLGPVRYDLAFGGAFYAYVDAEALGLSLLPADTPRLIEVAAAVKAAVERTSPPRHPREADLSFLYGVIFVGPPRSPEAHSRNVCVFADGEVDRSPTGTGVSGRVAIHDARGDLPAEGLVVESVLGTRFRGSLAERATVGDTPAVIPEIEGSAHVVGRSEFLFDPADPVGPGFLLR